MQNSLYYGDNLDLHRKHFPDESVDLIYLDPPFNSNRIDDRHLAIPPGLIRDFAHVVEREEALFGPFICLSEPRKQMRQEAEELGVVEGFGTRRIPRLQILTIKELLEETKRFDLPEGYIPNRHPGAGRVQVEHPELEF